MKNNILGKEMIEKIKILSHLKIDNKESSYFERQFKETLKVVDNLGKIDTKNIKTTNQVTGLNNVFREDRVDKKRILSQKEALSNAKNTYNGYFLVKAIFK